MSALKAFNFICNGAVICCGAVIVSDHIIQFTMENKSAGMDGQVVKFSVLGFGRMVSARNMTKKSIYVNKTDEMEVSTIRFNHTRTFHPLSKFDEVEVVPESFEFHYESR